MRSRMIFTFAFTGSTLLTTEIAGGTPELDDAWKHYKSKHEKKYDHPRHESARRKNWENTHKLIQKHNKEAAAGLHLFTMAENHYSDWTDDEMKGLGGYLESEEQVVNVSRANFPPNVDARNLPASVDLTNSSCMLPIQSQGGICASCWAFTAADTLSYALCKKTGKLLSLSIQQLIDCALTTIGCRGGWTHKAWEYVKAAPGQALASSYPYKPRTQFRETCKYNSSMSAGTVTGYVKVPAGNEPAIRAAVANVGAVAAVMQVIPSFSSYSSGIYSVEDCSRAGGPIFKHALIIVGYGTQNGVDYWILRNSWATKWGNMGYGLIRRGVNMCGIEDVVMYPTI